MQFIGDIRTFAGSVVPNGWALCNGQLLSISTYTALFAIVGTTYGGNGVTTFGLPDLRGRFVMGTGQGQERTYSIGQRVGSETVALTQAQIPAHAHSVQVATGARAVDRSPAGNVFAHADGEAYQAGADAAMDGLGPSSGTAQPHNNLSPFLAVNYIIALEGLFPSQS